jgi:hypothetical protein
MRDIGRSFQPTLSGRDTPLRVGIVDPHPISEPDAPLRGIADLLARTEGLTLQRVYHFPRARASSEAPLFRLYQNLATQDDAPHLSANGAACDSEIPRVPLAGDRTRLSLHDLAQISSDDLDVLIWLGEPPATGECSGLARRGVLSFSFGEPQRARRKPPYFWEAYRGEAAKTLVLQLHSSRFDEAVLMDRIVAGTQQTFPFTANADDCFTAAGPLLVRALKRLAEGEDPSRGLTYTVLAAGPTPSNVETLVAFARHARNSLSTRLRSAGKWRAWQVLVRSNPQNFVDKQDRFHFDGFRPIHASRGQFYADPFVVDSGTRSFLFCENFVAAAGRARLAVMELSSNGVSAPQVVVDRPYHMSYPFIFPWKREYFMIPESAADGTVQLLRCRRFPDEWQMEQVLCDGVRLVDTTAFHLNGIWYFFTYTDQPPRELYLFYAHRLDGAWLPHPANPISSDVRCARSAGALFYRNGRLIRPAQDCSIRYGYAVVLNEVIRISPSQYEEIGGERITPEACGGLLGVHTINRSTRYEVIDGLQWRRR